MKVFIITMQFPAPREIFANNDVLTLKKLGVDISVHSLRFSHKRKKVFEVQRGIQDIDYTHNSICKTFIGFLTGLFKPKVFFTLFWFIFRFHIQSPGQLIKSCILAPRVINIFNEFERKRPDVVHLYWAHYPSMLGYLVKKIYPDTTLTMSFVAYDLHMRFKGSIITANLADVVFTIARMEVSTLIKLGIDPSKIQTVYHGMMPNYFKDDSPEKIKGRVVSVGAFVLGKNMIDVVNIFASVQNELPYISLVLVGDGPLKNKVEKQVKELKVNNVIFLGHSAHETVIKEMRKAEVFLFMSEDERLPNVIKEAMAAKCYCITTDTPGIDELIPNSDYGSIISVGNLHAAEESLKKAINSNGFRNDVAEKAFNYIKINFNV
ncbi:MAG: glycosyltransferase, partial [Candidatus Cloacimonadales bacterium]|nr:glycosyltransferase [Candidatus Cloacimonadales bacterium]